MELNVEAHKVVTSVMNDATALVSQRNYEMKTMTMTTMTTSTVATGQSVMVGPSTLEDDVESGFMLKNTEPLTLQLPHLKAKDPVEIRFENIGYTVRIGFKGKKKVLHEVCGKFPPNKLIAIMGPSGAGKSTLLDLISGYRTGGLEGSGKVIVNDKLRILEDFRRVSCYIQQDDRIQPLLTVQENMSLAADLKLGPRVSQKEKHVLIDEILSVLNLTETKKTRGARLSGGQKKRLSIALELVNNPSVMFLDEPTTGLDSSSCSQCISLLRQLAHQRRTIICTIHQPSASLLQMFDQLYILSAGKCLYQGTTDNMIRYLKTQHIPCPLYHNPADFIIEVACGEYGEDKIDTLVNGINNGRSLQWFRNSKALFDVEYTGDVNEVKRRKKELKIKNKHMVPMYYQLFTLLRRGFIKLQRDQTLTYMRVTVNFFVSVMLGLIYVNAGDDATKMFDNYNLIFTIIMHHVTSAMMLNIISFPMEMNIVLKEHFNRWYSLKMYYLANTILDIPITTFSTIMFDTIIYFMSNQLFEWYRFFFFTLTSLCLVFVAQSLGYAFGTFLSVVNGTFAGPIFLIPMMMFSGFGVNLRDIPSYLEWGTHVSFFRYGLEVMVESIYGFGRKSFSCYAIYCHYRFPETFLQAVAMDKINVQYSLTMLGATIVLTKIISYYVLWWKVRYAR